MMDSCTVWFPLRSRAALRGSSCKGLRGGGEKAVFFSSLESPEALPTKERGPPWTFQPISIIAQTVCERILNMHCSY